MLCPIGIWAKILACKWLWVIHGERGVGLALSRYASLGGGLILFFFYGSKNLNNIPKGLWGIFILTEIVSSWKDAHTSGEAADKAVFFAIDSVSEAILSKRIADEGEVKVNTSAFNMKLQRTFIDAHMSINVTDDSDEVLVKLPRVPESSLKDSKVVDIQVSLRSKTQCKIICGYTGIAKK